MRKSLHFVSVMAFLVALAIFGAFTVVKQFGLSSNPSVVLGVYGAFSALLLGLVGGPIIKDFMEKHARHSKALIEMAEGLYIGMYENTALRPLRLRGLSGVMEDHSPRETDHDKQLSYLLAHLSSREYPGLRKTILELAEAARQYTRVFDDAQRTVEQALSDPVSARFPGAEHDYHSGRPYVVVAALAYVTRIAAAGRLNNPRHEDPKFGTKREDRDGRAHHYIVQRDLPFKRLAEVPNSSAGCELVGSIVAEMSRAPQVVEAVTKVETARNELRKSMAAFEKERDKMLVRARPNEDFGGWCHECPGIL